jgi:hypothetical protein
MATVISIEKRVVEKEAFERELKEWLSMRSKLRQAQLERSAGRLANFDIKYKHVDYWVTQLYSAVHVPGAREDIELQSQVR